MKYFLDALSKYADFSGRARRTEFWMFTLVYFVLSIGISILDAALGAGFLAILFALAMLVPTISITARRLHDTGRSGWWQLLSLIPLIGGIVLIIFLVLDSTEENKWGISPKFA
ncbi:DUF805 domain-containing protein [Microbulbifer sp. MLAF003]|uniref:DUF805 domain-containing protein n=1 Tax=Microbulbifer TaxID=48073 RepID=UPI0003779145|nr:MULTISPECIES: DUF805 domain-containing protein [Microbulbifer]WHI53020.1 DUF805 domain-containing protein [Microbulbifer sp. MLAF003]